MQSKMILIGERDAMVKNLAWHPARGVSRLRVSRGYHARLSLPLPQLWRRARATLADCPSTCLRLDFACYTTSPAVADLLSRIAEFSTAQFDTQQWVPKYLEISDSLRSWRKAKKVSVLVSNFLKSAPRLTALRH
jgi:hypothetical protein